MGAELTGYVLETGDQVSVVQFLQMLLKEGKLSEKQALAYVDALKKDIEVVEEKEAKVEVERAKAQEQAAKEESLLERAAKEAAEGLKKEKQEDELILRI